MSKENFKVSIAEEWHHSQSTLTADDIDDEHADPENMDPTMAIESGHSVVETMKREVQQLLNSSLEGIFSKCLNYLKGDSIAEPTEDDDSLSDSSNKNQLNFNYVPTLDDIRNEINLITRKITSGTTEILDSHLSASRANLLRHKHKISEKLTVVRQHAEEQRRIYDIEARNREAEVIRILRTELMEKYEKEVKDKNDDYKRQIDFNSDRLINNRTKWCKDEITSLHEIIQNLEHKIDEFPKDVESSQKQKKHRRRSSTGRSISHSKHSSINSQVSLSHLPSMLHAQTTLGSTSTSTTTRVTPHGSVCSSPSKDGLNTSSSSCMHCSLLSSRMYTMEQYINDLEKELKFVKGNSSFRSAPRGTRLRTGDPHGYSDSNLTKLRNLYDPNLPKLDDHTKNNLSENNETAAAKDQRTIIAALNRSASNSMSFRDQLSPSSPSPDSSASASVSSLYYEPCGDDKGIFGVVNSNTDGTTTATATRKPQSAPSPSSSSSQLQSTTGNLPLQYRLHNQDMKRSLLSPSSGDDEQEQRVNGDIVRDIDVFGGGDDDSLGDGDGDRDGFGGDLMLDRQLQLQPLDSTKSKDSHSKLDLGSVSYSYSHSVSLPDSMDVQWQPSSTTRRNSAYESIIRDALSCDDGIEAESSPYFILFTEAVSVQRECQEALAQSEKVRHRLEAKLNDLQTETAAKDQVFMLKLKERGIVIRELSNLVNSLRRQNKTAEGFFITEKKLIEKQMRPYLNRQEVPMYNCNINQSANEVERPVWSPDMNRIMSPTTTTTTVNATSNHSTSTNILSPLSPKNHFAPILSPSTNNNNNHSNTTNHSRPSSTQSHNRLMGGVHGASRSESISSQISRGELPRYRPATTSAIDNNLKKIVTTKTTANKPKSLFLNSSSSNINNKVVSKSSAEVAAIGSADGVGVVVDDGVVGSSESGSVSGLMTPPPATITSYDQEMSSLLQDTKLNPIAVNVPMKEEDIEKYSMLLEGESKLEVKALRRQIVGIIAKQELQHAERMLPKYSPIIQQSHFK
eukprot:gene9728-20231_t